jgi:hypothetical protein
MKRAEIEADQMPGQDSFLDVITNIVGILILLVLIVGIRTSRSIIASSTDESAVQVQTEDELKQAVSHAMNSESDISQLIERVGSTRQEVAFREHERTWLSTAIVEAEQKVQARRASLSTNDQRDFDLRHQIAQAQLQLDELTREQVALLSNDEPTAEIVCEPTPLMKVVTGKEVHLLLADDYVAIVPFDELLAAVKEDGQANVWRMRNQDEVDRVLGPINGWRVKYWIAQEDIVRRTEAGSMVASSSAFLSRCYLLPVTTPAGEPAEEAMQPNSEMHQHLQTQRPEMTTVTIWTYPGNFNRLLELKRNIRQCGFSIAVRPLPKGMPIGASRDGTKSVVEQ